MAANEYGNSPAFQLRAQTRTSFCGLKEWSKSEETLRKSDKNSKNSLQLMVYFMDSRVSLEAPQSENQHSASIRLETEEKKFIFQREFLFC